MKKSYKKGDIVIVRKKFPKWINGWTEEMDLYIDVESVVVSDYYPNHFSIDLLLKSIYDERIKFDKSVYVTLAYSFPIESIDNRKEKIERLLKK